MSWAVLRPGGMPPAQRHPSPTLSAGPAHTLWVHGHLFCKVCVQCPLETSFFYNRTAPRETGGGDPAARRSLDLREEGGSKKRAQCPHWP